MRVFAAIVVAGLLAGCASPSPKAPQPDAAPASLVPTYTTDGASVASALVFDPPITRTLPPMDLSRDDRHPSAFAGYQQAITTYIYSRTDDRQSTEFLDSYDRWTVIQQVGTHVR